MSLDALLAGPWLLLVLPLVLRALPWGRGGAERPVSWKLDLPLALGTSLAVALLCTAVLTRHLTEYYPLSAADFDHYCELVSRVAAGNMHDYWGVRLPAPAWLPAAASGGLGLIDGLALQSFLCLVTTCAGLYLWGLSLHSRVAGLAAALLVGAVGPVAFLARDVSFYPAVVAGSVLLAGAVAALVRFRSWWPALIAGVAAALLLMADVRGVLFAAPLVAVGLGFAAVRARSWRGALLRTGLLLAPVVLSWFVTRAVVAPQTIGLEVQAVMYADQAVRNAGGSPEQLAAQQNRARARPGFVWGRSSPLAIPGTFLFLSRLTEAIPAEARDAGWNVDLRERHLLPWLVPGLLALVICGVGLLRRPWRMVALLLCVAPFLGMLWATGRVLPQERHLATGLAALPLLLGLAVALLAEGGVRGQSDAEPSRALPLRRGVLLLAITAALLGLPPTWMSHRAGWRKGIVQSEPRTLLQAIHDGQRGRRDHCTHGLEQGAYEPWWPSRFYPRARRVLDGTDVWAPD